MCAGAGEADCHELVSGQRSITYSEPVQEMNEVAVKRESGERDGGMSTLAGLSLLAPGINCLLLFDLVELGSSLSLSLCFGFFICFPVGSDRKRVGSFLLHCPFLVSLP